MQFYIPQNIFVQIAIPPFDFSGPRSGCKHGGNEDYFCYPGDKGACRNYRVF